MTDPTAIYARVSTVDQHGEAQVSRLRAWCSSAGEEPPTLVFVDEATGKNMRRPQLERLMQEARGHHVRRVLVVKVDRWARSVKDLVSSLEELRGLGIEWQAVEQGIRISPDKNDATTNLILQVLGAVAEWEGSIISERTKQGLAFARTRCLHCGKPETETHQGHQYEATRLGRPRKGGVGAPLKNPYAKRVGSPSL
jgi:DNA invertase Pin-like site-specific DNA recombinase